MAYFGAIFTTSEAASSFPSLSILSNRTYREARAKPHYLLYPHLGSNKQRIRVVNIAPVGTKQN